ncbi:hypothetical protein [Amycolatopsis ultiminotia]
MRTTRPACRRGPKVVVDRNLYTGQNPGSSAALARRIVADVTGKE